ncbi:hypothetical protein TNCV_3320081 [Trichonephila clavipes]|nr:hypothetical protein TNCV_3320081 [Trichonephila clavipes]
MVAEFSWSRIYDQRSQVVGYRPDTTENPFCRCVESVKAQSPHVGMVLDESRSFFRVHTGYFSNIPKCIKAEFIASWACSQSSVVSSSKR